MGTIRFVVVAALLSSLAVADPPAAPQHPPAMDVRRLMDARMQKRTGLDKLSEAEVAALSEWLQDFSITLLKQTNRGRAAQQGKGSVVAAANDETFIIEIDGSRSVFKARTYCFGVNEGDTVTFAKSPSVCVSNTFVTSSGKACEVWCP